MILANTPHAMELIQELDRDILDWKKNLRSMQNSALGVVYPDPGSDLDSTAIYVSNSEVDTRSFSVTLFVVPMSLRAPRSKAQCQQQQQHSVPNASSSCPNYTPDCLSDRDSDITGTYL